MPTIQVLSTKPRAGKTAIATGLAQGLAREGARIQLLRTGSSESAGLDAETFAGYLFASAPASPVAREDARPAADHLAVVEVDAADEALDAPAIVVVKGRPSLEDEALGKALGARLLGSIATQVRPREVEAVALELTNAGLRPMAVLPEDRRLAAPSVEDIRRALAANVLYEGEDLRMPIQEVLVAPVFTDGAKVHFWRYPGSKAVLSPYYKTDLLLAAIEAETACLIVTGGHEPSHYVIDRVQGQPTTVLLAQHQTPAAVQALSDVWTASAFSGEAKAEAIFSLLDGRLDWQGLIRKL